MRGLKKRRVGRGSVVMLLQGTAFCVDHPDHPGHLTVVLDHPRHPPVPPHTRVSVVSMFLHTKAPFGSHSRPPARAV